MSDLSQALASELRGAADALGWPGQPAWLPGLRERALERFCASGLPDRRVERWKYTSLQALEQRAPGLSPGDAPAAGRQVPAPLLAGCARVQMLGGAWSGAQGAVAEGVSILPLSEALSEDRFDLRGLLQALEIDDRAAALAALNTAALRDGLVLHVSAGVDAGPVLVQWAGSAGQLAHARACVLLDDGARLDLVEQYEGGAPLNLVMQVRLAERARLRHTRLQQCPEQGILITRTDVRARGGSRYEYTGLDLGGGLVRHDVRARLEAPGAACRLAGASLTRGTGHVDNHLDAEHLAADCASEQCFRAVLADRSRVVFNGRVYVAPGADGTDARQSSAGLLLSPQAELDSKPELEIHADEVTASHGATVGQLDEDQLFYLRSRGLSAAAARGMLTVAFCRSVIDPLPDGGLREALQHRLSAGLGAAGVTEDV